MADSTQEAPLGLRARKKEQTRELIAQTARRLFSERGFERVTVAEVARAADVAEQTVFNYFRSKEDLVYWRLEPFEEELLQTIRDREPGESVLAAFKRFLLARHGLLAQPDAEARERLGALTRMIAQSPALLARERQILAAYTDALAALIAEETRGRAGDVRPLVAANAMIGLHRSLIDYVRQRILAGEIGPRLARDVRRQAEQGFALLEDGLGDYARRAP
jgi:AcrR family transcriptional regulator